VREQLSTTDSQANGRILDLKTGTVKKEGSQSAMRLCMGSRRGFICRLKVGLGLISSVADPGFLSLIQIFSIPVPGSASKNLSFLIRKNGF
jgi:hypothetical protein